MNNFNAKKYLQKEPQTSPWLILPFILTLTVIPFIMGLYSFDSGLTNEYWHSSSSSTDIFLHYKSFYLTIMGCIMALIFVCYRFMVQKKFSFGIAVIPIYVYAGCIVLSTIFSTSTTHSIHGIEHHFEPFMVLLTYCMIVLYGTYFVDNYRSLNWFINGFMIGVACLCLFGLSQYASGIFGIEKLEPFKTQFMADYIYMPTGQTGGGLTLNFPLGQVYMTLYNPNYVAYFTTLTAPFFAVLCVSQKDLWKKIASGLLSAASIVCLVGSSSLSGFISLAVSVIIIFIAFRKKIIKYWQPCACTLVAIILLIVAYDFISGHVVWNKVLFAKNKLISGIDTGYPDDTFHLRNITSSKSGVELKFDSGTVTFTMDYNQQKGFSCEFKDEKGELIQTESVTSSTGETTVNIKDKRYEDLLSASFSESLPGVIVLPICSLNIENTTYIVTNQLHTMSYCYNPNGTTATPFTIMQKAEHNIIGNYYYYQNYSNTQVQSFFQSFLTDMDSLKSCFNQIGKVTSYYDEQEKQIFNSSDPQSAALTFFNEMLTNSEELYNFFYYMTMSSDTDENYYFYNQIGKWTQIGEQAATSIFENHPNFASGRGFIWSRSLPLMFKSVKNVLVGTGPDTFAINYPHYDYVNLYRGGYHGKIITKPHSLYLQIGVQTGFISLVAVLAFYIIYLITCIRLYWKSSFTTFYSKVSVAILSSVSGYLFSGITNDSTVTYSYVFWGLMGVGIAVNRMEKKMREEQCAAKEKQERMEQRRNERKQKNALKA